MDNRNSIGHMDSLSVGAVKTAVSARPKPMTQVVMDVTESVSTLGIQIGRVHATLFGSEDCESVIGRNNPNGMYEYLRHLEDDLESMKRQMNEILERLQ